MANKPRIYHLFPQGRLAPPLRERKWGLHIGAGRTVRAHCKAGFRTRAQALAWQNRTPRWARLVGVHGIRRAA